MSVLRQIDSDLNIFALANGLDLVRSDEGPPARILTWYRDGMDRRIVLTPAGGANPGAVDVSVESEARMGPERRALRRSFREGARAAELRALLPQAVDCCNDLTRDEVEREGRAP